MIVFIEGKLIKKEPTHLIVECNGLGYELHISLNTYSKITNQENIRLHTYFKVNEDSHTLFGFFDQKERDLFVQLIKISGVGGSTALAILSSVSPEEFNQAVAREDINHLKKIKGIGPKTAGRIILELKGKLKLSETDPVLPGDKQGAKRQEAIQALMTLGYSKAEVEKKVADIIKQEGENVTVGEIVKFALRR